MQGGRIVFEGSYDEFLQQDELTQLLDKVEHNQESLEDQMGEAGDEANVRLRLNNLKGKEGMEEIDQNETILEEQTQNNEVQKQGKKVDN
jgi:molybdopterin converting factor small subunit